MNNFKNRINIVLNGKADWLRELANMPAEKCTEEDIENAYSMSCGAAWAYKDIGLITTSEALEWVNKFAKACEG